MIIRYGVWTQEGKRTRTHNDKIDIGNLDYDNNADGPAIRKLIYDKHPEWHIVGYGPDDQPDREGE